MTQALNALYPPNKQSFKAFLDKSLSLQNLGLVSNAPIANLYEFDFSNSIIYATNADREQSINGKQSLKPSESTAHKNLAFSLVNIDSHKKSDLIKATRAINHAIPSYNIIFFLTPRIYLSPLPRADFTNPARFTPTLQKKSHSLKTQIQQTQAKLTRAICNLSPKSHQKKQIITTARFQRH